MRFIRRIIPLLAAILLCTGCAASKLAQEVPSCYTFVFTDEDGNPVEGVKVSVCGENFCTPIVSGADGIAAFEGEPHAYEVHILTLPEGYAFDVSQPYLTEETYASMEFVLEKDELQE